MGWLYFRKGPRDTADGAEHEYWRDGWKFFYDLKMRLIHRTLHKRRLICDIRLAKYQTLDELICNSYEARYVRSEKWTDMKPIELQRAGYKKVEGLHDNLAWWGVPVYLRISGGSKFNIHARDKKGELLYSQDTAATLHDVMQSRATEQFLKGMGKTKLPEIDLQKMLFIGIIAAGAVFGLWMLGFFR